MTGPLLLAVDQGSSATKAALIDVDGAVLRSVSIAVGMNFPRPGWVEQSPTEIVDSVSTAISRCTADVPEGQVQAIGLSTQRESLVMWDAVTGEPVGPLISWQDQRTAPMVAELTAAGHAAMVRKLSGLPLDPMFSAPKASWLLDTYDPDRSGSRSGRLRLGTVDSWLMFRITGAHPAEIGNASRSQLLNVATGRWDPDLLALFDIPEQALGEVTASVGPFPQPRAELGGQRLPPVTAVLGDSHAALFAHGAFEPGAVKATYGTGSSIMGLGSPAGSAAGICRTIAWDIGAGPVAAVEGNIRSSGATVAWAARLLGCTPAELAELAAGADSDGVHLVPGFSGLAAPWWDAAAQGVITGLSFGTGPAQIARAALESVAFQVADVVIAMDRAGVPIRTLLADGGASANPLLMQLQADVAGRTVVQSAEPDLSALGAGQLAGYSAGVWDTAALATMAGPRTVFEPALAQPDRAVRLRRWRQAVARSRGHAVAARADQPADHDYHGGQRPQMGKGTS